jgi:hypothetical protein
MPAAMVRATTARVLLPGVGPGYGQQKSRDPDERCPALMSARSCSIEAAAITAIWPGALLG